MYRSGPDYDRMAKLAIDIFIDYNITSFPINIKELCRKLGVALIPYSEYATAGRELLMKRSKSSFYIPPTGKTPPMIFFNDSVEEVGSHGNMRRNIIHEIIHYISGDIIELPEDDDLADYFGKYFLAPIPYLIFWHIFSVNEIISTFGVDAEMAGYINKNLRNRVNKYGMKIFDYEQPLLKHLVCGYHEGGDAP